VISTLPIFVENKGCGAGIVAVQGIVDTPLFFSSGLDKFGQFSFDGVRRFTFGDNSCNDGYFKHFLFSFLGKNETVVDLVHLQAVTGNEAGARKRSAPILPPESHGFAAIPQLSVATSLMSIAFCSRVAPSLVILMLTNGMVCSFSIFAPEGG
jgi:hypothetical protein